MQNNKSSACEPKSHKLNSKHAWSLVVLSAEVLEWNVQKWHAAGFLYFIYTFFITSLSGLKCGGHLGPSNVCYSKATSGHCLLNGTGETKKALCIPATPTTMHITRQLDAVLQQYFIRLAFALSPFHSSVLALLQKHRCKKKLLGLVTPSEN